MHVCGSASASQFMSGQFVDSFGTRQITQERLAFASAFGWRNDFVLVNLIYHLLKQFFEQNKIDGEVFGLGNLPRIIPNQATKRRGET